MSKALAANEYSFRTVSDDNYTERVAAEADPKTNILLITDENKITGEKSLIVLVRKHVTALSLLFPELKLGSFTLDEWMKEALKQTTEENGEFVPGTGKEFISLVVNGEIDDVEREAQTIEQQARQINNILKGRVIQVSVKTF